MIGTKLRLRSLCCSAAALGLVGCASAPEVAPVRGAVQEGLASYYGRRFHGRLTASGERFDMYALTAAHRTLPFGTQVGVINLRNGSSVQVRITDRGPFVRGRIVDLSYAAAARIGMLRAGVVPVRLMVLGR